MNPIIDWTYGQVWLFLRTLGLPYCSLYDQGYTSLGKVNNTRRNPSLASGGDGSYAPAYMLADWKMERSGRETSGEGMPTTPQGDGIITAATAAIVIIGDEVLKGKVEEINRAYATAALKVAGVRVGRVTMVPDDEAIIAQEVRAASEAHDLVITSGGVGPTHDDVTIKAICTAFGVPRVHNDGMELRIMEAAKPVGGVLNMAQKQMCLLPQGSMLLDAPGGSSWPILRTCNVFILPGIPQFFRAKMDTIAEHFVRGTSHVFHRQARIRNPASTTCPLHLTACAVPHCTPPGPLTKLICLHGKSPLLHLCVNAGRGKLTACLQVSLKSMENDVVQQINGVVRRHPAVDVGSYPFVEAEARTIVTFEAPEGDEEAVLAAVADFQDKMGDDVIEVSDKDFLPPSIAGQRSKL